MLYRLAVLSRRASLFKRRATKLLKGPSIMALSRKSLLTLTDYNKSLTKFSANVLNLSFPLTINFVNGRDLQGSRYSHFAWFVCGISK